MTIIEAICKALADINAPATYEDIYNNIIQNKYYEFGADDPLSVVRVKLRIHSDNANIKSAVNKRKYFSSVSGKGKSELFKLLNTPLEPKEVVKKTPASNKKIGLKYSEKSIDKIKRFFTIQRPDVHKIALIECFWMLLGAFLPIITDSVMRTILLQANLIEAFNENVKGGEVFLLTSALITPFYFLLYKYVNSDIDYKKENKLPYFGLVLPLTLLSSLAGLFAFSYYRIGLIIKDEYTNSPTTSLFDFEFGGWAWAIYLVSLIIWYYSSYMNHLGTGEYKKIRRKQFIELKTEYEQVRGVK
ncbi:hypothetical protein Q4574_14635 [Aliiglaciecola sp. 3_MG-2023]|uniref:hypothetical protein n=1 Tax=Aliiglaciecola sp. 3_MG-2023 TaxID=3062644 RepID=UPI0026E3E647|nr:hypothetical protein [Aliiglaciecola sp. 3_MG-2023]MDO6694530.1 hypothetical protein [Aliiglaciecola sp. 3_MG-2023]